MDFILIKIKNIYTNSENAGENYDKENIWIWESGVARNLIKLYNKELHDLYSLLYLC
jgi:hypothetical protein